MNILVPHSWLTEYLETKATPRQIADALSMHSASVERLIKQDDDWIYDIEVTGNRIDMASVTGIARDAAVVLTTIGIPAKYIPRKPIDPPAPAGPSCPITIENDPALCRRILAVVIDHVSVGKSPQAISERLEKSGVRSLNTIVDVTNYVMLETGHPTHVFDYDRIPQKKLIIRPSKKGEMLTTFEGKTYALPGGDIVIDDGSGTIIDLPGIAGTKNSVVTKDTKRILFFIESNDPYKIRQTSMSLNIHTYAAHINKNRPDPELAMTALLRGIELYTKTLGGRVVSSIIDLYPHKLPPKRVTVSQERIDRYMGTPTPSTTIITILTKLGFEVTHNASSNSYEALVPSWRHDDVSIPQDLIEEVARIHGYHNLPSRVQIGAPIMKREDRRHEWIGKAKHALKYWGFTELYSFSLVSEELLTQYGIPSTNCVTVKNPLGEEGAYMRPSLIPGVLSAVDTNKHHRNSLRLFELSRVYKKQQRSLPAEPTRLTFALYEEQMTDSLFYQAKGVVEALLEEMHVGNVSFSPREYASVGSKPHPTMYASMVLNGSSVGCINRVGNTILVDIDFDALLEKASGKLTYIPIPSHPPVIEDITITLGDRTHIGPVMQTIQAASPLVAHVALVSSYKQNYTFRIWFQHQSRNLTDTEVGEIKKKITASL